MQKCRGMGGVLSALQIRTPRAAMGPAQPAPYASRAQKKSAAYRFAIAALPGRVEDSPGPRKISISVHSQADGSPDLNDHSSSRQNSPSNVQ